MGVVGSTTEMGHPLNGQDEPPKPRRVYHLALCSNGHVHSGKETETATWEDWRRASTRPRFGQVVRGFVVVHNILVPPLPP